MQKALGSKNEMRAATDVSVINLLDPHPMVFCLLLTACCLLPFSVPLWLIY